MACRKQVYKITYPNTSDRQRRIAGYEEAVEMPLFPIVS
jgi:hypothetical protein